MRSVTTNEADRDFSRLLTEVEQGQDVVITRSGKPVAVIKRFEPQVMTPERKAAIERVVELMENAPSLGTARRFTRDEMHER